MDIKQAMMVANKLLSYKGFKVKSIAPSEVVASLTTDVTGELSLSVSGETCVCHGGRLSLNLSQFGHHRVEYDQYGGDRTCPDSELEHEIDKDMIPALESLINYSHRVVVSGESEPRLINPDWSGFLVSSLLGFRPTGLDWEEVTDIVVGHRHQYSNKCYSDLVKSVTLDAEGNATVIVEPQHREGEEFSEWVRRTQHGSDKLLPDRVATSYANPAEKVVLELIEES